MKQHEAVIQTLENLGGIATLGQLNQEVFKIKDCQWNTKTPFASIRRIVQTRPDEIYKVKPGLYGLVSHRKQNEARGIVEETDKNKNSKEVTEFNHSYYQGLIILWGNLKNLQTFLPHQDKNKWFLTEKKLGEITTLSDIPRYSYEVLVNRSATIDVIWFAPSLSSVLMPHSFYEVEHNTDFTNSLAKFTDLQDFSTEMFIVADGIRKGEYETKIESKAFRNIKKNVKFLDYKYLAEKYEMAVKDSEHGNII